LCTAPREYLLLAETLDDALAMASVVYKVNWRGALARRRRLPGVLRLATVAAVTPDASLADVVAALQAQAAESLVVVFSADDELPERLKRATDSLPRVVSRSAAPGSSYAATLAAVPRRARAERLAADVLDAVFSDARRILDELESA